jgi:hypothetical protein
LLQDRAGDRDIVVLGEPAHRSDRRIADRRQPVRQLGARLGLDLLDQAREHAIEQRDVILFELVGAVEEERRDPLQGARAALG